jgi:hypothetical protein
MSIAQLSEVIALKSKTFVIAYMNHIVITMVASVDVPAKYIASLLRLLIIDYL